jgi:hypothetical protein
MHAGFCGFVMAKRSVGVNDRNLRIGEDHQNAVLSDREVEQLLQLRREGWGYKRLAKAFEVSKAQVRRIVSGKQRHQIPRRWVGVPVPD